MWQGIPRILMDCLRSPYRPPWRIILSSTLFSSEFRLHTKPSGHITQIIIRFWIAKKIAFGTCVYGTCLEPNPHVNSNALRAWTGFWQRTPESSLDPRNPNGPVPFTSAALLGLAYVRLAFDIGPYRIASCQDAKQVADRFLKLPLPSPSPYLLPAILHATHALSIPIKLGIKFIAKSHAFVWSVQHSLCGLEFAICTNKWLSYLSDCQKTRSLSGTFSALALNICSSDLAA